MLETRATRAYSGPPRTGRDRYAGPSAQAAEPASFDARFRASRFKLANNTHLPAYEIGKAWLALDEKDKAMDWLERALEQRSYSMVFIHVDPQLDALRNEPCFQALADRVHPNP